MHGGDIYRNDVNLDFSVNLNPLGMPDFVQEAIRDAADLAGQYPDPEYRKLREAIGRHYGVSSSRVVCGNGASELITGVCRAALSGSDFRPDAVEDVSDTDKAKSGGWIGKSPAKALIMAPGFAGYRRALSAVHADVITMDLSEKENWVPGDALEEMIVREEPQLVLLANPSNPTGVLLSKDRMTGILNLCRDVGAMLCVDECFMELTDRAESDSMIPYCGCGAFMMKGTGRSTDSMRTDNVMEMNGGIDADPGSNLIVLSAITKTFAVPGVRIGYAFCSSDELAVSLSRQLPEWNVSTIAEAAAVAAFQGESAFQEESAFQGKSAFQEESAYQSACQGTYLKTAREMIGRERQYLKEELSACGCKVVPSEANYLLFRVPEQLQDGQQDLYHLLLSRKILIRDCSDYEGLGKGWYRVAVRRHEDNKELMRNIHSIIACRL